MWTDVDSNGAAFETKTEVGPLDQSVLAACDGRTDRQTRNVVDRRHHPLVDGRGRTWVGYQLVSQCGLFGGWAEAFDKTGPL